MKWILSALLFSTLAMTMENQNHLPMPPDEFIWLNEHPEIILFNLSIEKKEKIIDDFLQAGFNDKWQYFWMSQDAMPIKITKALSFYQEAKQYFKNKDKVDGIKLLARTNIIFAWAFDKVDHTRELRHIYQNSRQSPIAKMYALTHMSAGVLHEEDEVLDKHITMVFEKISALFLQDIKETKKSLDSQSSINK